MKKLAVIGYPASHSLSPMMHNYISKRMTHDFKYDAIEVSPDALAAEIEHLREDYAGFNVTAPHKFEIMRYLDEISEEAEAYGAVNTVLNQNGKLIGYNTDAEGFCRSILREGANIVGANVLILGAGGAAQPIVMKLAASGVDSITILNRTRERAQLICDRTREYCGFSPKTQNSRKEYDIIVNCTSLGMGNNKDMSPIEDFSVVQSGSICADLIYNPSETLFLKGAKMRGAKTINGLGMLIYQGIAAYEIFSGKRLPDGIDDELFELLKR